MLWKACADCTLQLEGCAVCRAGAVKREAEAYIKQLESTLSARNAQLRRCGELLAPSPELESCLRALGRIK